MRWKGSYISLQSPRIVCQELLPEVLSIFTQLGDNSDAPVHILTSTIKRPLPASFTFFTSLNVVGKHVFIIVIFSPTTLSMILRWVEVSKNRIDVHQGWVG